ncbi:MAG TPA: hypothetical protein VHA07_06235 [Devosia sp.]|nr:hypothetical protein [Devosia sp.]
MRVADVWRTEPDRRAMRLPLLLLCLGSLVGPSLAQEASSSVPISLDASSSVPPDQSTGPPLSSSEALRLFVDACTAIGSGAPDAYDKVKDAGWVPNEPEDAGPYNAVYSGYRDVPGFGEVDIWGSLQSFPSQRLGYCRIDFSDNDNLLDFKDMAGIAGLAGTLADRGDGNVYGAWESPDRKLLVLGDRTDGAVEIEFNLLLGGTPAGN